MNKSAILHYSDYIYAYAVKKDTLRIRLRTAKGDFDAVRVYYKNLYDQTAGMSVKPMALIASDKLCDYYEADLTLEVKRFKYYFELMGGGEKIFYTSDGLTEKLKNENLFFIPYLFEEDIPSMPKWTEGALIYQVLIDRFYDGDASNNPRGVIPKGSKPQRDSYYGGDLTGLTEKLPYIKSLGADAVYLSPLFSSPSYHKYDTEDYYKIEDIYGGEEALKNFIQASHKAGIKVIFDAVFNHCSDRHFMFKDVEKNLENSKYYDYFCLNGGKITKEPLNYETFAGMVACMPRLNTSNAAVQDYLIGAAVYWTKKLNIDGWRLDVADEVSHILWQRFYKAVKEVNPQAVIIGEIWNNSTRWLLGGEMDTATNYKFRKYILDFAADSQITAEDFWQNISHNEMKYKTTSLNYLLNLTGSHDTIRTATLLKDNGLCVLVYAFLLTYRGMALIYYGDETGMEGDVDPDNRRYMQWEGGDAAMLSEVSFLGNLRRCPAFKNGGTEIIRAKGRLLAFIREYENEKYLVAVNFEDKKRSLGISGGTLIHGGGSAGKRITVNAKSFIIVKL